MLVIRIVSYLWGIISFPFILMLLNTVKIDTILEFIIGLIILLPISLLPMYYGWKKICNYSQNQKLFGVLMLITIIWGFFLVYDSGIFPTFFSESSPNVTIILLFSGIILIFIGFINIIISYLPKLE